MRAVDKECIRGWKHSNQRLGFITFAKAKSDLLRPLRFELSLNLVGLTLYRGFGDLAVRILNRCIVNFERLAAQTLQLLNRCLHENDTCRRPPERQGSRNRLRSSPEHCGLVFRVEPVAGPAHPDFAAVARRHVVERIRGVEVFAVVSPQLDASAKSRP